MLPKLAAGLKRWVIENLELTAVILVCALLVVSLWVGVAYRPTVVYPPPLPPAPDLTLNFSSQTPQTLTVNTTLTISGNGGTKLEIDADGDFSPGQRTVSWNLYVMGFTGDVCTAKAHWVTPEDLGGGDYSFMQTAESPLTANSSYLSATLPPVTVPSQAGTLTRTVSLGGSELMGYQLGSGTAPTTAGPQGWTWKNPLSTGVGDPADTPLYVSGSSTVGIQQASNHTFVSGIAFGVGFSAVIALLLALPDLADKRAQRRKAEPAPQTAASPPPDDPPPDAPVESHVSADDSVESGDSHEAT